ncbi:helix-turn-helix transcriptional regulator [Phascolarctobacterium faecium]|uniref:helix-turn-helix domain-containing protein n=1 Tax=Phascolarctobacterium faecium TaxID=33025 RepID=UPI003079EA0C
MNVKDYIYSRRKQLNLTLEDVATHVGVSKSTVKKWETGFIKNMRRDKLALLAEVLQIPPTTLLNDECSEKNSTISFLLETNETNLTDDEKIFLEKFRKLSHDDQMLLFGIMDSFIDARKSANLPATGTK